MQIQKNEHIISAFGNLRTVDGLWSQAQLDKSRTVVYWNDWIDIPSGTMSAVNLIK